MDDHHHRTTNGFSWKNRRGIGLTRDRQAPPGRFFSTASCASRSTNNSAIDTPQILFDITTIDADGSKPAEDCIQQAVAVPFVKQIPNRGPRLVLVRQISPRRTGPQCPKNGIHDFPTIPWRPTSLCRRWKKVRNTVPLLVRKLMPRHSLPPWLGSKHHCRRISRTRKYQFSDKA